MATLSRREQVTTAGTSYDKELQRLKVRLSEAGSATEGKGLRLFKEARHAYILAVQGFNDEIPSSANNLAKRSLKERIVTIEDFLILALKASERAAEAKSVQSLVFHSHLASATNDLGWQKRVQRLLKAEKWTDPALERLEDKELVLPCDRVKGTSADERIRSKLDCVKEVLERPKMDYDSNPDMAHRLLAQLTIDREICPPTFSGIETFQALLLKNKPSSAKEAATEMDLEKDFQAGTALERGRSQAQRKMAAKLASKKGRTGMQKLQDKNFEQVLAYLLEQLQKHGKDATSGLFRVSPVDLSEKVTEFRGDSDVQRLVKAALQYWLDSGGLPVAHMLQQNVFEPPSVHASRMMQLTAEEVARSSAKGDAAAMAIRQALQGHGFVHEVDLPTALPRQQPAKEASSSDSGGATWMYPLIGREPSMLQTAQTFQEALLKAHQSGVLTKHAASVKGEVLKPWSEGHMQAHWLLMKSALATTEFGAFLDTTPEEAEDMMTFQFLLAPPRCTRAMLSSRGERPSEEDPAKLAEAGLELIQLIQGYGRLSLLRYTSAESQQGDLEVFPLMWSSFEALETGETVPAKDQFQLGHLHKKRLLFHNRFPCHLLGPDVDQPLEKSLADIDPQSCKAERDRPYKQILLDIIIDALWILKRNKLLTSGLVYSIAVQTLVHMGKDGLPCSVHSVCWEDLGRLKWEALRSIAIWTCVQLGGCQNLLKDYLNAKLMLTQAIGTVRLGQDSRVEVNCFGAFPQNELPSAAFWGSIFTFICQRPVDHSVCSEEEGRGFMVDFVSVLYKQTNRVCMNPIRTPQLQPPPNEKELEALLRRAVACVDVALEWLRIRNNFLQHHMAYLDVITQLLQYVSHAPEDCSDPHDFLKEVQPRIQSSEKASAEFRKQLQKLGDQVIENNGATIRKAKEYADCFRRHFMLRSLDNMEGMRLVQKMERDVQLYLPNLTPAPLEQLRSKDLQGSDVEELHEYIFQLLQLGIHSGRGAPETRLQESIHNCCVTVVDRVLLDLVSVELRGMHMVDAQMEGARLAALDTLRMIEERTIQLNVHGHFEWAALECLKDKLNALSAARGEERLAEEEKERKRAADELLRELDEEESKKRAVLEKEEKRRRKSKAATRNAKLEEERAAREKAEEEAAAQRKAKEEAERERERKEQEEMCAKKEEWERMQREMSQAAQTTTPAGSPKPVRRMGIVHAPRPKQGASGARGTEQRERRSSETPAREGHGANAQPSSSREAEEAAPEQNGHSSAADCNGSGSPLQRAGGGSMKGGSSVLSNPNRIAAAASGSRTDHRHQEAANSGAPDDGDFGAALDQGSSSRSKRVSKSKRGPKRDIGYCLHCHDKGHLLMKCPQLEEMNLDGRAHLNRHLLAENTALAEHIMQRWRNGEFQQHSGLQQSAEEPKGSKRKGSSKHSGGESRGCLHCSAIDHRVMDCPALAGLDHTARTHINQVYVSHRRKQSVEDVLRRYLGDEASEPAEDPGSGLQSAQEHVAKPAQTFCMLCHTTGHLAVDCPYAQELPSEVLENVVQLAHSGKRHYALNMIVKHWRNTILPKHVPLIKGMRSHVFCCHCDSDHHRTFCCPELQEMPEAARLDLDHAYGEGNWHGKPPEQLYHEWLQQRSSCPLCSEQHIVEDCPELKELPLSTYNAIMEACKAGKVNGALQLLEDWRMKAAMAASMPQPPAAAKSPSAAQPPSARQATSSRSAAAVVARPALRPPSGGTARSVVTPLETGFWRTMKVPAKDPPLGGVRVRTDMKADLYMSCTHCLDKKHNFKDCPELACISGPNRASLMGSYKDGNLGRARKVVESAVGCRICKKPGHWLPTCPRLPRIRELKKELEEIYMRGPVEAAVRLARNAMDLHLQEEQQLRPPAPITSPLPEAPSWASPAQRSQPVAAASAAPSRVPVNWAAAVRKGTGHAQQQTPANGVNTPPAPSLALSPMPSPMRSQPAADGHQKAAVSQAPKEQEDKRDVSDVPAEPDQGVRSSEGVWSLLTEDSSDSALTSFPGEASAGASVSSRLQPAQPTALKNPSLPPSSPAHMPHPILQPSSSRPPPAELLFPPMPSASAPVPAIARPLAAALPAARMPEHICAAGNATGYTPYIPSTMPPGFAGVSAATAQPPLPAAPKWRAPPGFLLSEEAPAQKQHDQEAASGVFGGRMSAVSGALSGPPLPGLAPAEIPFQPTWLRPAGSAPPGFPTRQPPAAEAAASAPAAASAHVGQAPAEAASMDDFLLGLLGVKCSKAAPQHHESLPRPIEAPLQDQDAHVQEERPVVARQRRQEEMWRSVGSSVASPSTTVQQSAWSKPLAASIFSQPAHAGSPAAFLGSRPSPSRIGPRAWPEQGSVTSQDVQAKLAETAGYAALEAAATEELESEPEEDEDEDDEQEQLNAAIQASLQEQGPFLGAIRDVRRSDGGEEENIALTVANVATPGLQNLTGEYNCFLNAIVQCLWHCAAFRSGMLRLLDPEQLQEAPVVRELLGLFRAFEHEGAQQRGSCPEGRRRQVVAPNALREALSDLDAHLFSVGEMSDAAEVLNAVYESLDGVEGGSAFVDSVFGLRVREVVHCSACGCNSHEAAYTQLFYNVSATALRLQAMAIETEDEAPTSLGQVLREVEGQTQKSCDTDKGGCGRDQQVLAFLEGMLPAAFTLQLAWESHAESSADIRDTMATIQEVLDLGEVYLGLERGCHLYRLRSMVCYYGSHYHAFVHTAGKWIMFDDANTSVVGSWDSVMHKCQLGKIQPSVLFFNAQH